MSLLPVAVGLFPRGFISASMVRSCCHTHRLPPSQTHEGVLCVGTCAVGLDANSCYTTLQSLWTCLLLHVCAKRQRYEDHTVFYTLPVDVTTAWLREPSASLTSQHKIQVVLVVWVLCFSCVCFLVAFF